MPTWLVFEDEPQLYEMVLNIYETFGVDGLAFATGEDAVEWIEKVDSGQYRGEIPQLALVDIHLPGKISGIDVGLRLRQSPRLGNIALVLMTAFEINEQEKAAIRTQTACDLLLHKPLPGIRDLHTILHGLVADRN